MYRQTAVFDDKVRATDTRIFGEQGCSPVHLNSYEIILYLKGIVSLPYILPVIDILKLH